MIVSSNSILCQKKCTHNKKGNGFKYNIPYQINQTEKREAIQVPRRINSRKHKANNDYTISKINQAHNFFSSNQESIAITVLGIIEMKKSMSFSDDTRADYLGTKPKAWKRTVLEVKLAIGGGEASKLRDFRCHRRDLRTWKN